MAGRGVFIRLEGAKKDMDFKQDGGKIQREKDIYHHGPKHILIICRLLNPTTFSLPTSFKKSFIDVPQNLILRPFLGWRSQSLF
jgi:hypothetical protein